MIYLAIAVYVLFALGVGYACKNDKGHSATYNVIMGAIFAPFIFGFLVTAFVLVWTQIQQKKMKEAQ